MLREVKDIARRWLRPPLHRAEIDVPYRVLGTEYGGWPLLARTARRALVFSFGIGEDVSFDIAAIEQFRCRIHGFDPTPKSRAWVEAQTLPSSFIFHPLGIADHDGTAEFFPPTNAAHVSYSVAPPPGSQSGVETRASVTCDVLRLETIVKRLRVDEPEIPKMDIEGSEYSVLDDILKGSCRPSQLLVEFHHDMYGIPKERTLAAVEKLRAHGYRLFYVSSGGHDYAFARS